MSAWTRIAAWFRGAQSKENPVGRMIMQHKVGQPQWAPREFRAFAREGYMLNPYVFRAVELRAQAIGGLKWVAVRRTANGDREELPETHPLNALMRRPQPRKGTAQYFSEVETWLSLTGNAYVVGAGPTGGENAGRPRELWALRPDRVEIIPGDGPFMPVASYRYKVSAQPHDFPADLVLHLKRFHPDDDFFGLSPLEPGGRSVDHNNESRAWNVALLQNGTKPDGAFVTDGSLTTDQRDAIMEQYRNEHSGPENAGMPLFLEGGLSWEQQGLSPKDMDWLEGTKLSSREIANTLGVPPEMVGDAANKTYSNYQEARKAFYQDTVLPEADMLRDEHNAFLAEKFGAELDYDRDGIEALREDREKLWVYLGGAWQDGRITKNESRVAMGYDEVDGGDEFITDGFSEIPGELPEDEEEPADEQESDEDESAEDDEDDGTKGIAITKAGQRILAYKAIDRRRSRWVKAATTTAQKRLTKQRDAIVSAIRSARGPSESIAAAEQIILGQRKPWESLYRTLYVSVGRDFAKDTLRHLKASAGPDYTKADDDTRRLVDRLLEEWIRRHSGTKIRGLLDTDLEKVRDQLAEGVREGEGVDDLAKRIDAYLEPLYKNRAETVARTEVIPASNLGSQMAARATGLPIKKSWLSTPGARTRETHTQANGQTVEIDQPYVVAGQKVMFPGDPSLGAAADETINCRCSETYDVQEND